MLEELNRLGIIDESYTKGKDKEDSFIFKDNLF